MQGRLPHAAADLLKAAAKTPITQNDPLARVKAIEKANQRIKDLYPHYFLKAD
jgi:hypothetical protein